MGSPVVHGVGRDCRYNVPVLTGQKRAPRAPACKLLNPTAYAMGSGLGGQKPTP